MREFIEELKHNQNINFEKDFENRIDIDYVIERLEDIQNKQNTQFYSNEKLEQMAIDLNEDLTLMEQMKLARNLLQLIHGDLFMQQENEEDKLNIFSLSVVANYLDKIIKKYEVTPKMELDTILRKNFKLEEHPTISQYQHSYALLINLLYDLGRLGVLSDYQVIVDKLDKIESGE